MRLRVSVYLIYVLACLLAIGVAALSGVTLLNTFSGEQRESERAQLQMGTSQVSALQALVQAQMRRMRTASDANSRQFLYQFKKLPDALAVPNAVIPSLNHTVFETWVPAIKAPDQVIGFGAFLYFPNATTGEYSVPRALMAFWEPLAAGGQSFSYAYTPPAESILHVHPVSWPDYSSPQLGQARFTMDPNSFAGNGKFLLDDYFEYAYPWATPDGNAYWTFSHLRSFFANGAWISVQTYDAALSWVETMANVSAPQAHFVAFDNQGYVLATTNPEELLRVADCQSRSSNASAGRDCILSPASTHPVPEIRTVYNALFDPRWNDVTTDPTPITSSALTLDGHKYLTVTGTLFSKNHLRITGVWYQPWVTLQGDAIGLTTMVCILTMLSTFLLTVLGVFGVLRPLLALGSTMRAVARSLKEGQAETEEVLPPRKPNVFHEVDTIGQDFETIVVDFLGFSCDNARDNRYAPKDPNKPFAVAFTDIQASTQLWGKDPAQMSRCLQAHHEIIRELIKKHRLYEVKTVGDSFIVTTTTAHDALHFALDLQTRFYQHDWGWDVPDELYRATTLTRTKADGRLVGPAYHKLWNGLRVRVGIHYGLGEVTYDVVSKGYDYYGTVVNTAARMEAIAHGGQVIVSQNLINALFPPLWPSLGIATSLGTFPMRGVAVPPALVEVKPTSLRGRMFPPLRVEIIDEFDKVERLSGEPHSPTANRRSFACGPMAALPGEVDDPNAWDRDHRRPAPTTSSGSANPSSSDHPTTPHLAEELARTHAFVRTGIIPVEYLTQYLLALHRILEHLLRPLAPQQHSAVTKALARGWGAPPPKSKADCACSIMHIVQRLSETTEVLQCLRLPNTAEQSQPGNDSLQSVS